MELSLDEAETAFLHDILADAEKLGSGYQQPCGQAQKSSPTSAPLTSTDPNPHSFSTVHTADQRNNAAPHGALSSNSLAFPGSAGRPPLPRTPSQQPRSTSPAPDLDLRAQGPTAKEADSYTALLQPHIPRPQPQEPRQPVSNAALQRGISASLRTPSPLRPTSSQRQRGSRKGVSSDGSASASSRSPQLSASGPFRTVSPPRCTTPTTTRTCPATPPPTLPATVSATSASAGSEASSGSSGGSKTAARSRSSADRFTSGPLASVATPGADAEGFAAPGDAAPALATVASTPATFPSRRARSLLQRIRGLESQLQQMLQEAEHEVTWPAPVPPPPGPQHPLQLPPQVYLVAEQLCRDYNSSGVALMEAGLDEAARQQLDKALLLAGPGGPLEGRPDKQRELQIVAHNNIACYHRKLHQPARALESLQLVASLETAAAAESARAAAAPTAVAAGDRCGPYGPTDVSAQAGGGPGRVSRAAASGVSATGANHVADGSWQTAAGAGGAAGDLGAERELEDCGPGCGSGGPSAAGPTAATLLNMAACCGSLGHHGQALAYAEQAVQAAVRELQVSLPALEAALHKGLPQVQLWDVLPQLRRASAATTTQLATAYYNRAVEQEHLHLWQSALESYRLAVDVASRFVGRGAGLTLTMQQSAEAFKVRLRRLDRQGKLRSRAASARALSGADLPPGDPSSAAAGTAVTSDGWCPAPGPMSSNGSTASSMAMAISRQPQPQPQPRTHLRSLRCNSSASGSAAASVVYPLPVAVAAPQRRQQRQSLPAIARGGPPPDVACYPQQAHPPPTTASGTVIPPCAACTRPPSAGGAAMPPYAKTGPPTALPPDYVAGKRSLPSHYPPGGAGGCGGPPAASSCRLSESGLPNEGEVQLNVRSALPARLPPPPQQQQQQGHTVVDGSAPVPFAVGPAPSKQAREVMAGGSEGIRTASDVTAAPESGPAVLRRQSSWGPGPGTAASLSSPGTPATLSVAMLGRDTSPTRSCGVAQTTVAAAGMDGSPKQQSGHLMEWAGRNGLDVSGSEGSLAAVAAAAAAAAAELARMCEEGEAVPLGALGSEVVAAFRQHRREDEASRVGLASCREAVEPPQAAQNGPAHWNAVSGVQVCKGVVSEGAGGGQVSSPHVMPATRNMLVPKRDGVTV